MGQAASKLGTGLKSTGGSFRREGVQAYPVLVYTKFLTGPSSLMIYEKWGNMKYKYRNREFWCRGYYVDTAGKDAKKIKEYIQHQLDEDRVGEQLTLNIEDPFTGSK